MGRLHQVNAEYGNAIKACPTDLHLFLTRKRPVIRAYVALQRQTLEPCDFKMLGFGPVRL